MLVQALQAQVEMCKITKIVAVRTILHSQVFTLAPNVLALGAVADFGAQNCQYTTKVDAR